MTGETVKTTATTVKWCGFQVCKWNTIVLLILLLLLLLICAKPICLKILFHCKSIKLAVKSKNKSQTLARVAATKAITRTTTATKIANAA